MFENRSVSNHYSIVEQFGAAHLGEHGICAYLINLTTGDTYAYAAIAFWTNHSQITRSPEGLGAPDRTVPRKKQGPRAHVSPPHIREPARANSSGGSKGIRTRDSTLKDRLDRRSKFTRWALGTRGDRSDAPAIPRRGALVGRILANDTRRCCWAIHGRISVVPNSPTDSKGGANGPGSRKREEARRRSCG